MKYLVTGAAGFIGYHVSLRLLQAGEQVIGLDNLNTYYEPQLKLDRLNRLKTFPAFNFVYGDISDYALLENVFSRATADKVCHLAAQAGVRYSLKDPFAYQKSNLDGFLNILECCRKYPVMNLVFASSSSVYGNDSSTPFKINDRTDQPLSLYAATKKANELMAYTYHHLYGLKTTGLRFFTVYGPWGRPDMAYFKFTRDILEGKPIDIYNHGQMERDFTYIDDIVEGVISALDKRYEYEIFNLGNSQPEPLIDFINYLEKILGKTAQKNYLPLQPGDMVKTYADISYSIEKLGYQPKTKLYDGLTQFVNWYREYYQV
jgi:UDP-glucuronate 4-epimerase